MADWLAAILAGGIILISLIGGLLIFARSSDRKRRWTMVGLLVNEEMNANDESIRRNTKDRREARKLPQAHLTEPYYHSTAHHSHHNSGGSGSGHNVSHHHGGFDGGGFHDGGHHG